VGDHPGDLAGSRKRAAPGAARRKRRYLLSVHRAATRKEGKMAYADEARSRMEDANAQIARLREQVESLMRDRVTPVVADFASRAESAMSGARGVVRDQADAVSGRVREQPLIAILIAAGIGWALGRIMR
jgi:ElaB/YqjD/DUF883 family membrane-anchored ribosome-binding protein